MSDIPIKILIVENSVMQRKLISKMIHGFNEGPSIGYTFDVVEANTLQRAKEECKLHAPDLILLALILEDSSGLETVSNMHNYTPSTPIVVLTGTDGEEIGITAIKEGAQDYLVKKTVTPEILKRTIFYALQRGKLLNQVKEQQNQMEKLAQKLSKYLDPQVYDSIFHGKKEVQLENTRKQLTVCFTDIVQFTPRAEKMEEKELSKWLNNYLNEMAKISIEFGGTLDKFIGDAVMIFFGDPESRGEKNDAINCVKMALQMQKKAREMEVDVRIGIHTGLCTVGNFGSEQRMDYTIIGRPVNLAARLESNAQPGRILLSDYTHDLVKESILCMPNGEIQVKGIDRDIMTYWAVETFSL